MSKRKIYLKKYEKAISHIKCNTVIDEMYLNEVKDSLKEIKKIKGVKKAKHLEGYFNHIDFVLKDKFGIEVEGIKELIK